MELFSIRIQRTFQLVSTALAVLFLIFSIISMAFAVCIPKKIHSISVFLFLAFILESE